MRFFGRPRMAIYALLALAGWAAPASSELLTQQLDKLPEPLPALEREGPWLHVCEARPDGERCRYEQTASTEDGVAVVLMLIPPPEGSTPVALFRTPFGVFLPDGLGLSFDGHAPARVAFRTCNQFGCLASVPMEGEMRSRMANGSRLAVEFTSEALQSFRVEFSLNRSAAILSTM